MARLGKTAQEFIQGSFSPIIAILPSNKVQDIVSKNNLSFVELLQPFLALECEGQFREPNGTVCIVKNLRLIVRDVNWKPLQPTEARRQLNNAVLHNYNDKTVPLELEGRKFIIPQATIWFDSWRETYFEVQFPSDHEYTKHFLSCMCVATTDDDNVIETFTNLNQQFTDLLSVTPPKLPKWFNSNVQKSYVLLHDVSSIPKEKADAMFESMKQSFEPNSCFMLSINSRNKADPVLSVDHWAPFIRRNETNNDLNNVTANAPTTHLEPAHIPDSEESNTQEVAHPLTTIENVYDNANSLQTHSFSGSSESVRAAAEAAEAAAAAGEQHGAALSAADVDAVKRFLQEYTSKALLPFVERQITVLSEAVSNRKGVSRSLLSATKRWFGTGKGGNTTGHNSVIYSSECPELQLRRLGDLWFMFGQWQRAFDTYHTAKREFYADAAWLCYAGALEMAALSAFMAGEASRKTHAYMEESIVTYLNTCRMVQYAVRATLLSALCLGSVAQHGEAAKQLIRMTSEDSDLRSAMLLEQAAACFLRGPAPGARAMARKYAFHMVLAGHRFSKAGQKKHAYRCYKQAYQVYEGSGWRLSTDHVQFALGRLAGSLRRLRAAAGWLAAPLAPASPQPAPLHRGLLRDYMLAHQQWVDSAQVRDLVSLPLPLVEHKHTALVCAGPAPLSAPGRVPATSVSLQDALTKNPLDDKYWHKMEEMLLQVAKGSVPMIFKPTVSLFTATTDESPVVPQGEPIQISITLRNPLKVPLLLKDLELLWKFKPNVEADDTSDEWLSNEPAVAAGAAAAAEANLIFGPKIKSVTLEGEQAEVLTFSLTPLQVGQLVVHGLAYNLINGGEENEGGQILTISGKVNLEPQEGRLRLTVVPSAPCLQMTFSESNKEVIGGELLKVDVEVRNVGPVALRRLLLCVSHPDAARLAADEPGFPALHEDKFSDAPPDLDERGLRLAAWRRAASRHVRPAAELLQPGASCRAVLLLRPRRAAAALRLLAYYEGEEGGGHRLLRHVFHFDVTEVVEVVATPRRSVDTSGPAAAEKMILAVEVQNISDEKCGATVEVLEASLLSRQWTLRGLVAARDKGDALAARDKLHVALEAARRGGGAGGGGGGGGGAGAGDVAPSGVKINDGDPYSHPDITAPPFSNFVLEYKTPFIESDEIYRGGKRAGLIQSMLVVRWRARKNGRSAIGQHCVWLDCFAKTDPLENDPLSNASLAKEKQENVVLFKMEHDHHVKHNFDKKKICIVPITINIVNCYGEPVDAYIDMTKTGGSSCALGWAGALGGSAGAGGAGVAVALQQHEARRVRVRALVAAPGTYLLGEALALGSQARAGARPLDHLCAEASLLVVQQA